MKILLTIAVLIWSLSPQQQSSPATRDATKLVNQFKSETVFWKQFEIGKQIIALRNPAVLTDLTDLLRVEDRHIRGNVAFIFASMGDQRGLEVITAILADYSDRAITQGIPGGNPTLRAQIRSDRYYAAHLLGDLKDPRAVPILIPLLRDTDVNRIVPWSLGEIGDHRADEALILTLSDPDPSMRVLAILALQKMGAKTALPRLRELESDQERSNFGDLITVAAAAKAAIAKLESNR